MIKQFLTTCFERENIQNQDTCGQCLEPITNPLCHNCLSQGISQWLSFYPNLKKNMMPKLKKYVNEVNNSAVNGINCMSCNKRKAALCPYCFTEGVLNILRENKVDKQVLGDFLNIFNFDIKHEGYIKEAIIEGLY